MAVALKAARQVGRSQTPVRINEASEAPLTCPVQPKEDEVADATVAVLRRVVLSELLGIAFLSGGQSGELASARLNAIYTRLKSPSAAAPWALTFLFACAIQEPAPEIWAGEDAYRDATQRALIHRARCNRAVRQRRYTWLMEATAGEPVAA